jgi:ribosomal protein L5
MRPINISFDAYGNICFGLTQNEEAKNINFSKKEGNSGQKNII